MCVHVCAEGHVCVEVPVCADVHACVHSCTAHKVLSSKGKTRI